MTNKNLESVTFRTNAGKINEFAFFAPTVQYMIYCGDKRPQGADLYQKNFHSIFIRLKLSRTRISWEAQSRRIVIAA